MKWMTTTFSDLCICAFLDRDCIGCLEGRVGVLNDVDSCFNVTGLVLRLPFSQDGEAVRHLQSDLDNLRAPNSNEP